MFMMYGNNKFWPLKFTNIYKHTSFFNLYLTFKDSDLDTFIQDGEIENGRKIVKELKIRQNGFFICL